ncbi:sperm flagellar protein 1-like [Babylonia areolata]|uniref:sperm flagellar protein 1-like n=1 Tax=Babylonia areolata TaxID=304850 RepID=UPI003FD40F96
MTEIMSRAGVKNLDNLGELSEQELEELYSWIDGIPLSRPKRNIARDFSDGVLVAEVIKHKIPKLVELHNYCPVNSTQQKMDNWFQLNRKVFKRLNFELAEDIVRQISNAKVGMIERVLFLLQARINRHIWEQQRQPALKTYENEYPEADQNTVSKVSPRRETKAAAPRAVAGAAGGAGLKGFKQSKEDVVPLILLEEKEQEVLAKNETIQILQAKIKRLEHLLHLKDIRIEDLQQGLEFTRATGKR